MTDQERRLAEKHISLLKELVRLYKERGDLLQEQTDILKKLLAQKEGGDGK